MKQYILTSLIVGSLCFSSCNDEYLTNLDETKVSAESFYQTESDFELANVGMYVPLRTLYGNGVADYGAWAMGEMRSDHTCFMYNMNNRGYADREYIDQFIDDSNGGGISTKYSNNYIIIGRANQILARVDEADISESARNNYKGQALFLRAFAYFDLVQYFGDVPLVIEAPTTYDETIVGRTSASAVYEQIIKDATEAARLLPSVGEQATGYVANGAAYTLLGNVYLVLEEWANAEDALLNVTGYSLMDDYASIFNPSNKNNNEMIFEVQYAADDTKGTSSYFGVNFLPSLSSPGVLEGYPENSGNNQYAGWNAPTPDLVDLFDVNDLRFEASIAFFTGEIYENQPYVKKFSYGCEIFPHCDEDWPVYRYAEVLLMLAEAVNEQGGRSGEALSYLNAVHAHSRTGLSELAIADQAELRDAIMLERQFELAFENKRWLDLVRTGRATQVMQAQCAKVLANPQAYYYPEGVYPSADSYQFDAHRLLFPIPNGQIEINPLLTQNDGY